MEAVEFRWPGRHSFEISVKQFVVEPGERVLLLGPSGAGKSTLLSLICGVVLPCSGSIEVLGEDFSSMSATARDRFRAEHFGVIFQMFNLLPYASALDNVVLPLSFAPSRRKRAAKLGSARAEAKRLLAALGLDTALATGVLAGELSVGQQQRAAAARALIGTPQLIVADEPTSALDSRTQNVFLDLLFAQIEEASATLIMVSHDERLTRRFDRVARLCEFAHIRQGERP